LDVVSGKTAECTTLLQHGRALRHDDFSFTNLWVCNGVFHSLYFLRCWM
jgi:hypothetical protein